MGLFVELIRFSEQTKFIVEFIWFSEQTAVESMEPSNFYKANGGAIYVLRGKKLLSKYI